MYGGINKHAQTMLCSRNAGVKPEPELYPVSGVIREGPKRFDALELVLIPCYYGNCYSLKVINYTGETLLV